MAENFEHDAKSSAADNGMPVLRTVRLLKYYWHIPALQSGPIAETHCDEILRALTDPLTPEEIHPSQAPKLLSRPVRITSGHHAGAVENVQKYFNDNRWSDGLAILPPTREAVDLMLTGTTRSREEIIGPVKAKNGIATVENIAINAVMAGASPEYLPVILAAMEGLTHPEFDLLHPQASLGGFELAVWVSGPLAAELGMNFRDRLWTYGNLANSSIGRAILLCRINLGHMWPGLNDMARTRSVPFTNYTFGENNVDIRLWRPYHTVQGFEPQDSCVSVSTVSQGLMTFFGQTTQDLIQKLVSRILSRREAVFSLYRPGLANPGAHPAKYVFMITPEVAEDLATSGQTHESLRHDVYEAAAVPYEQLTPKEKETIQTRIDQSLAGNGILSDRLPPDRIPVWEKGLKPGWRVPILVTPEDLHFVVAGAAQGRSIAGWSYFRAPYTWSSHRTTRIRNAALTQAGR